jgi:FlaA1/EpsC-like NDP-sugar epimerase
MGKSKKLAESILLNMCKNFNTDYVIVRFGNVLGTRGSVSEIFRKQILKGGPITITNPDMRRYFMTPQQAVQLVLIAATHGMDGDIIIPNLKKQIYITDLIAELIKKIDPVCNSKIKLIVTGSRKGEKLEEQLFSDEEKSLAIQNEDYYRINYDSCLSKIEYIIEEFKKFNNSSFEEICESIFSYSKADGDF